MPLCSLRHRMRCSDRSRGNWALTLTGCDWPGAADWPAPSFGRRRPDPDIGRGHERPLNPTEADVEIISEATPTLSSACHFVNDENDLAAITLSSESAIATALLNLSGRHLD